MPKLKEYYESNKSDEFEIIAFHDASAKTFEELDEKMAPAKEKHWNNEDLPFPILMDSTGDTIRQFNIQAFPTIILIDPEGRLVGRGDIDLLKKALEGEVETPEPMKPKKTKMMKIQKKDG